MEESCYDVFDEHKVVGESKTKQGPNYVIHARVSGDAESCKDSAL